MGEREWGDKSNYLGEFENSELNGVGVMVRRGEDGGEEGEVYRGEWKDDKPHGHGILEDGKVRYEGGWKEGKFEGWGVQKDEHGMFMGGFVGGMKQGEGVAVFGDGTIYVGAFWEDDFEGVGKFFSKGGSYHGEFKKNKVFFFFSIMFIIFYLFSLLFSPYSFDFLFSLLLSSQNKTIATRPWNSRIFRWFFRWAI